MYELIEHKKLDAAAANIVFTNIPQNFSDLLIIVSSRNTDASTSGIRVRFNNDSDTYSSRYLYGSGGSASSGTLTNSASFYGTQNSYTANTFSSATVYIPNYTSSAVKPFSADAVAENNAASTDLSLFSNLWDGTDPITQISLAPSSGNLSQNSSATLYGINRRSGIGRAPLAMGGYMS